MRRLFRCDYIRSLLHTLVAAGLDECPSGSSFLGIAVLRRELALGRSLGHQLGCCFARQGEGVLLEGPCTVVVMVRQVEVEHAFLVVARHVGNTVGLDVGDVDHAPFLVDESRLDVFYHHSSVIVHGEDESGLALAPRCDAVVVFVLVALVERQSFCCGGLVEEDGAILCVALGSVDVVSDIYGRLLRLAAGLELEHEVCACHFIVVGVVSYDDEVVLTCIGELLSDGGSAADDIGFDGSVLYSLIHTLDAVGAVGDVPASTGHVITQCDGAFGKVNVFGRGESSVVGEFD